MNKPLIVMAMPEEGAGYFDDLSIVYTGIGKVNASYALTKACITHKPDHVVNLGSAGSNQFQAGTLVSCTQFIQRDMDATALDVPLYHTPFEPNAAAILAHGSRVETLPEGICGSGDSFCTAGADAPFNVMDMEAYALAKICQMEGLPFTCIKFITDGADGQAADDWNAMLSKAARQLRSAYDGLPNPNYNFS